jgi:dephospho-CoA kinase
MIVIGLTGGIGTGKSEAARILQDLGAVVINADQVGHSAYTPHSEIWSEVVQAFGRDILDTNDEIDRRKLGAIVFSDSAQLERLNRIMHPRMARMVQEQIDGLRENGAPVVVVEAAVLFEAGWDSLVDEVWSTAAPEETVVARLVVRNGLPEDEARKRINAQMSSAERAARSQAVVDNSEDIIRLREAVQALWETRVEVKVGKV